MDASLGDAHLLIAEVHARHWEWLDAELDFRRALALSPGNAKIHRAYGAFLARTGAIQRSYEQLSVALARDPRSALARQDLARVLLIRGEVEAATELAHTIRAARGAGFWPDELMVALKDPSRTASAVSEFAALEQSGHLVSAQAVLYYAWLGQLDKAYSSAKAALADKTLPFEHLWGAELMAFRKDPRFGGLMQNVGLTGYWQSYGPPDACIVVNDKLQCQ